MHIISDKLRCPLDSYTEQFMSYQTIYDVPQIPTQNNAYHIGQAMISFRYQHRTMHVISDKQRCPSGSNTEQCISFRTSYNFFQTLTQNNACISYKLRCPSDTNTEQCMSYRTIYDVLQTLKQNNAYHTGQAAMSFRH